MIYEPREDSYLLQKYVHRYAEGKVLDVGTGSGIQARTALEHTPDVLAVDINPEAVEHCQRQGIPAKLSDLFTNVSEKFDLIIFNPPYLPEDQHEDAASKQITTGGKKGNELLERFLQQARKHLAPEGKILLIISSLTPAAEKIMDENGYCHTILERQKLFFEELQVYLLT
ncbi:MAG: DUF2431 domain-containing protein [Nanoarchaeota archaeon]|nr:DUF2431 domain-containing protein [Nanoarchaeota archaeon]